jgi:UDP-N-acetylglucosamine 2-epimerase (non-hydrolysing)
VVLVEGDTNPVLAGALAAVKLGIKVGHVAAGLRSYVRRMPEETNRVLTDHCSDYLFAPTRKSKEILLHESIAEKQVFVVGNTAVDAVIQNLEIAKSKSRILCELGLNSGKFMLATSHRQEKVDSQIRFAGIIKGLQLVNSEFGIPVIYPIHSRGLSNSTYSSIVFGKRNVWFLDKPST